VGDDYLSIAKFWLANKKHASMNYVCPALGKRGMA
jgi:hypothetical protein